MTKVLPFVAAAAFALTACEDSLSSDSLLSDDELTADIAASAGDAIATAIESMAANEGAGGLPGASMQSNTESANTNSLTFNRTRTCYDANGTAMTGCSPIASVRKIVTHVTVDGTRSGSHTNKNGQTANWTGAVHRVLDDTVTRNFNGPSETSRTHSGVASGNDTTNISGGEATRVASEAATDSIKAVTWNLPRSSNPFPVSGSIKRVVSVNVAVTRGSQTQTRTAMRTIQVTFPADAQGNVTLTINNKTCQLNLVTHVVSNCQ